MTTKAKKRRPPKAPPLRTPQQRTPGGRPLRWFIGGLIATFAVAAIAVTAVLKSGEDSKTATPTGAVEGLPITPDYHSLSVDPANASRILLGTHQGLYSSSDGGKTWEFKALSGQDAMNLARRGGQTLWTAGHNVLAKSTDGGRTWRAVTPSGLPSLDLHGFAVDPSRPQTLYAAVAGEGLYRSTDNGNSFSQVSAEVGGAVMALAVTPSGEILAGDMEQGLLLTKDRGKTWRPVLRAQVMGLALNPRDPKRVLAAGPGVVLSADGGRTWRQRLEISQGAGPVAWSPSNPKVAYAVGFDRTLYRSTDSGETWSAVG